jgi:hypothetical protein
MRKMASALVAITEIGEAHLRRLIDRWFGKDRLVRFHDEAMALRVLGHAHIGCRPKGLALGPQKIFQALRISYR